MFYEIINQKCPEFFRGIIKKKKNYFQEISGKIPSKISGLTILVVVHWKHLHMEWLFSISPRN